jgi:hypothetical protein
MEVWNFSEGGATLDCLSDIAMACVTFAMGLCVAALWAAVFILRREGTHPPTKLDSSAQNSTGLLLHHSNASPLILKGGNVGSRSPKGHFASNPVTLFPYLPKNCLANTLHAGTATLQLGVVCCGIVSVLALFFAAHTGVYAEILVDTRVGNSTSHGSLLQASLSVSVCTYWNAGAYISAIFTFLTAGLVPYIKCCMMAFSVVAPRNVLSVKARKALLHNLEHLNKFTLSNNVSMVILSVVCNTRINDLASLFFPEPGLGGPSRKPDVIDISIFVEVRAAFFLSLAGSVLSWAVGVGILCLHRVNEKPASIDEEMPSILLSMQAEEPGIQMRKAGIAANWGRTKRVATFTAIVVTFLTILRASVENCFFAEIGGLSASLLPPGERQDEYALASFYQDFVDAVPTSSILGVELARIVLKCATLVLPLLHLVMLFALHWCSSHMVSLTPHDQWQLYYATELVSGASCLHVFVGVTIAYHLELELIVQSVMRGIPFPDSAQISGDEILLIWVDINAWLYVLMLGGILVQALNRVVLAEGEESAMARIPREHQHVQVFKEVGGSAASLLCPKGIRGSTNTAPALYFDQWPLAVSSSAAVV